MLSSMDWDSFSRLVQMVLGIGLVIFVHELGHFLAARMCRVRVETFSLGFGPKLFGWKRGDTTYQVAALPIGGFCRMAGEDPTSSDGKPQPYELRAKPVGQRFFIYSGGVLMNVAFAAVVLPMVLFHGVPFPEPVIGQVTPGGGAWHARLEPGTRVLEINGSKVASFEHIATEIALGPPEAAELLVLAPGESEPRLVRVETSYDEEMGIREIGISSAAGLGGAIRVAPDSPAARAGLEDEDRLVSVVGALPERSLAEQLQSAGEKGEPVELLVEGPTGARRTVRIEAELKELPDVLRLGVGPVSTTVDDLRPNADLAALGLRKGDKVLRVDGVRVFDPEDVLDAAAAGQGDLRVLVERDGVRVELAAAGLDRARRIALVRDVALDADESRVEVVLSPWAAAKGQLEDGDRIRVVNGVESPRWTEDFLPIVQEAAKHGEAVQLLVEREGSPDKIPFTIRPGPTTAASYGFGLREAVYEYRAGSVGEALAVGMQGTWRFATDTWQTIKRMVLGHVSSRNMGGIISIGVMSYTQAEEGLARLLFFLCLLSMNLAIINVLPIPLLDGGHLFFLLIEKIKGKPVSERVFGYSQVVGLVLILTLVIYVTYNDLRRFDWIP